jgi:hypothetical protein
MPRIIETSLARNGLEAPASLRTARAQVLMCTRRLISLAMSCSEQEVTYVAFEKQLVAEVFGLARAVISLFLVAGEQRLCETQQERVVRDGRTFRRAPAQSRNLFTWFGVVRYRRTYLREVVAAGKAARGFHPLDAQLGLLADRLSPNLLSMAVRLATRVSFSEARELLSWFLPSAPSTEVIEAAVLGYARHTQVLNEAAPRRVSRPGTPRM